MRKAKILIKSFEELKEIFSEEEMKKTFRNLVSAFSLSELNLWFGSGIERDAEIIEPTDYRCSCEGYAVLACKKDYQIPTIELFSQANGGEYFLRFDEEVDITVKEAQKDLISLLKKQQEEVDITATATQQYHKELDPIFQQEGSETFNIYLHPSAWTEA